MERQVCQFQTVSTKGFTPGNCAKTVGTPVEGTSLLSRSPIGATDPPSATGGSLGTLPRRGGCLLR
jgi:hypothetical protein